MPLLHVSLNADAPEPVARFIAAMTGGVAQPFYPIPGAWMAFGPEDDGRCVEIYPLETRLLPGPHQVAFEDRAPERDVTYAHIALCTPLGPEQVIDAAKAHGWQARLASRGPFECVEVWVENRLMLEFLDAGMQADYAKGMTLAHWKQMFGNG